MAELTSKVVFPHFTPGLPLRFQGGGRGRDRKSIDAVKLSEKAGYESASAAPGVDSMNGCATGNGIAEITDYVIASPDGLSAG